MSLVLPLLVAAFLGAAFYLVLSTQVVRILAGVVLLGNGANLLILAAGRLGPGAPPLVPAGLDAPAQAIANPLPQALVLTAIVISFSIFAFLLVLAFRAYQDLQTDEVPEMRLAEPRDEGLPPLGY